MFSIVIVIFFAIGIHEYCHCKFADMAGDPTPRFYGRVTLNLFKHFDPIGTLMMFISSISGYGIGWGKPAPINPSKMRNPRMDTFVAVAAGPLSNLAQAAIYGLILRICLSQGVISQEDVFLSIGRESVGFLPALLTLGVWINLSLTLFNLIPFGILDGHWLVGLLMPEKPRHYWFKFNRTYGWGLLIALILVGQATKQYYIWQVLGPPFDKLFTLITGIKI